MAELWICQMNWLSILCKSICILVRVVCILLCMAAKVGQGRLIGGKMIHLKNDVGRELYRYPGRPERWMKKAWNIVGDKGDKTEAFLLWVHHEKAGFFVGGREHSNAVKSKALGKEED